MRLIVDNSGGASVIQLQQNVNDHYVDPSDATGAQNCATVETGRMLRPVKEMCAPDPTLVRILPCSLAVHRFEFRIICDCQRHAARERKLWRRSLRMARRHGVALAIGVPLIVGAIAFPSEAMNRYIPLLSGERIASPNVMILRDTFFAPAPPPLVTLDATRHNLFAREVPYGEIIYREAKRNGLSPELVAAVVESESDFDARLVSSKNARGLMQIIPETGRLLGCENPFNPEQNIGAGTKYLRQLLDRFGDERLALAAYNAGERNIERFGGVPPFDETRDYVQRVARHTREYQQKVRRRFLAEVRVHATVQQ